MPRNQAGRSSARIPFVFITSSYTERKTGNLPLRSVRSDSSDDRSSPMPSCAFMAIVDEVIAHGAKARTPYLNTGYLAVFAEEWFVSSKKRSQR